MVMRLFGAPASAEREAEEPVRAMQQVVERLAARLDSLEQDRSAALFWFGEVERLGERLRSEAEKLTALAQEVTALDRRVAAGEKDGEALRLRVVAVGKQLDWEMDSARKSVAALIERTLKE